MTDCFQNEIPKARVNITLNIETADGIKKKELPLKILVLGDFSGSKKIKNISDRERININKNNFNSVVKDVSPNLSYSVENKIQANSSELSVNIGVHSMESFNPDEIVSQVPELKNMLAIRNLLKDLKANLLDNHLFRRELERIVKNKDELYSLKNELKLLTYTRQP
jgi:type VI secretion system protein ImpB